jgi:hypothetical protein
VWPLPKEQRINTCFRFDPSLAGQAVFLDECKRLPSDAGFDFSVDCSIIGQTQINPASNTDGTGSFLFDFFRGAEPSGDYNWGIFAPGDTTGGVPAFYTGYLRVTVGTPSNNGAAIFAPFTLNPAA